MHSIQSQTGVTESLIMNTIFKAVRKTGFVDCDIYPFSVKFEERHNGMDKEYLAEVFNNAKVVGCAIVDKFDI